MVRIKTSKGWKTIKPGQTIRGVTNVTKKKSSGSRSSRQTTRTTTKKPTVSKITKKQLNSKTNLFWKTNLINKMGLLGKAALIKKVHLDLLFILKSLLKRRSNKRMTVNIETVPRTVITRGFVGPPIPYGPQPNEIIVSAGPLSRVGGGGGGGSRRRSPVAPIIPVTPTKPSPSYSYNRGPLSSGKRLRSLSGASTVTLYLEDDKSRRVGSKLSRKIDGYYIMVKKNKKKVRLRLPLLTLNDAIDLLAYKLDNNSIIIGEVVRYGKTDIIGKIPANIKGYFVKNQRKFAIILLKNGFNKMLIEKKKFRNDKHGEMKRKRVVKKKAVKRRVVKKKVIKRKKPVKRKRKK